LRTPRLVFVNQYAFPDEAATAQLLADLVEACREAGAECGIVCSDRSYGDPARRHAREEVVNGVRYSRATATGFGRSSRLGRVVDYATFLWGAMWRLLSGTRPDVVVGMSTPPILGALAVLAARFRGCRSAYWAMDVYPDLAFALGAMRPGGLAGWVFGALSRWALRKADLVIALGDTMAERLRDLGGRNVVAVHNWADGNAIRPMPAEHSSWRRAGGWDGRLSVVYSGNMGVAHEFDTLLDAAAQLGDEVWFAFVGGGPRRIEVEEGAARRGLSNVEFHPPVPREGLGDLLAAGDVHMVTLRPGMPGLLVPSKLYGILAAGRPVVYVGPAEGEAWETVSGSGCGTCLANGDVMGLVEALRRYGRDPLLRATEGGCARLAFESSFTKERQTARIVASLTALAGRGAK
jgi:colanic acid biosynthesis glycosyl transferase WcaI